MKPHLREILTDLKAAARIGHMDTIQSALDGVRGLDSDEFPPTAIRPMGTALTTIRSANLRPLLSDPDPAIRGIAAVALAEQYVKGKGSIPDDLRGPANDRSPEVRAALLDTLTQTEGDELTPKRLYDLSSTWLTADNELLVQAGLVLLPFCNPAPDQLAAILMPMHLAPDYGLRSALVDTLGTLAEKGHDHTILSVLDYWAEQDDPNVWVITKALSLSWSKNHSPTALVILHNLAAHVGSIRPIARAIARHEPPS